MTPSIWELKMLEYDTRGTASMRYQTTFTLAILFIVGLLTVTSTSAQAACLDRVSDVSSGPASAVALDGRTAAIGFGRQLTFVDLTAPANPVGLGSIDLPGVIRRIDMTGDIALAICSEAPLQIIDLSSVETPTVIGELTQAVDIARHGTLLYLLDSASLQASAYHSVWIMDISNPAAPVVLSSWTGDERASDLAATEDGLVFVAVHNRVLIYDMSVPSEPVQLAYIGFNRVSDLAVSGDTLLLTGHGSTSIFDISDVSQPSLLATLDIGATDVAVSEGYAYLVGDDSGIHVVDIGVPANPVVLHGLARTERARWGVAVGGGLLLAPTGAGANGVWVVETTDPDSLVALPSISGPDSSIWLRQSGDLMLSSGRTSEPLLWDLRAELPQLLGKLPVSNVSGRPAADGNLLFVPVSSSMYDGKITVFDVSLPDEPQEVASLAIDAPFDVALAGPRLYVGTREGLKVVDVSDPTEMTVMGALQLRDAEVLELDGDRLYVGQGACIWAVPDCAPALRLVDISEPTSPRELSLLFGQSVNDLAVRGNLVFVTGYQGLKVVSFSNPLSPTVISSLELGRAWSIELVGRLAVVTGSNLWVVDIGDPLQPVVVASLGLPGAGYDVDVVDGEIWIANGDAGLSVVTLTGCGVQQPRRGGSRWRGSTPPQKKSVVRKRCQTQRSSVIVAIRAPGTTPIAVHRLGDQ